MPPSSNKPPKEIFASENSLQAAHGINHIQKYKTNWSDKLVVLIERMLASVFPNTQEMTLDVKRTSGGLRLTLRHHSW